MPDVDRVARDLVLLALRLDRLVPGLVGNYLGPAELRRRIDLEPVRAATDLGADADRLTAALAGSGGHREQVLLAQLDALGCTADRLAGRPVPFVREVERCLGVQIGLGDEDAYRAAHRDLDALLPGPGPLAERVAAHRRRDELAPEHLRPAVHALAGALRERVREPYRLPADESVVFEVVDDAPWAALHQHRGGHRSVVRLNAGARLRAGQLAQLVAHEAYPGHHTELARLRDGPIDGDGQVEHTVSLVLSPCSVISEGLADTALAAAIGPGWGEWSADVLAATGVRCDGELVERVDTAMLGLQRARQDAALLLHDRGAGPDAARRHLRRWLLVDDERAGRVLGFLTHPVWRAYTTAYVEGYPVVREHLGADRGAVRERHARLLGAPTTPALLGAVQPH